MNGFSNFNLTCLSPQAATIAICIFFIVAVFIVIRIRKAFTTKADDFTPYNFSLTPSQRKANHSEQQKKYLQQCFDETVKILKLAVIKKTYASLYAPGKTIYTIPLNPQEAIMFIWAKVIECTDTHEQDRVIRTAALILGSVQENKTKHLIELEAFACSARRIYEGAKGLATLQIRAVENVSSVSEIMHHSHFRRFIPSLTAEKVEFTWPSVVLASVEKLKSLALHAVTDTDLNNCTHFPCISCKMECSIFDLKELKCPTCRKN